MGKKKIGVYALIDQSGKIVAVNSEIYLKSLDGWTKIDEGNGDKYALAQNNYLPGPIETNDHIPLYRWDGEKVVPRTVEEIDADRAALPKPEPTDKERIAQLEGALAAQEQKGLENEAAMMELAGMLARQQEVMGLV